MLTRLGRKKAKPGLAAAGRAGQETSREDNQKRWFEALIITLAFLMLVAAVTRPPQLSDRRIGYDIDSHPIAQEEVRADMLFWAEDLQATERKREEAAAKAPDAFSVDLETVRKQLLEFQRRVDLLEGQREEVYARVEGALKASNSQDEASAVVWRAVAGYAAELRESEAFGFFSTAESLAIWLLPTSDSVPTRVFDPPEDAKAAKDKEAKAVESLRPVKSLEPPAVTPLAWAYRTELARLAREQLEYVLQYGVCGETLSAQTKKRNVLILRENQVADLNLTNELAVEEVPTVEQAQDLLAARVAEAAKKLASETEESAFDWTHFQSASLEMAKPLICETLRFNEVYTVAAQQRARQEVEPEKRKFEPGEVLQRSGDRWTAQSRSNVKTYWGLLESRQEPAWRGLTVLAAHMIMVGLVLAALYRSIALLTPNASERRRNLNLPLLLMVSMLVLGRVVSYFEPSGLILPLAACGILLAILVNAGAALITSILTATLASIQFDYDWRLLIIASAMSVAGVFGIHTVRRRSDMTKAATMAAAAGLLMILAITLASDSLFTGSALRRLALVGINGVICMFLVPGALSPLEKLFGITTDIQLLEYSDLNNELLSRLAIEIPATHQHSLMLGQLAEAAAVAINANGLLARVCAYYHDIGKLRRPEYFSENQTGVNIHDDLSPRTSARAIAGHVFHGVELAHAYHLPKPIIDAILEHHGTSLISFFYDQAREQNKHDDVEEKDFRYPGPKPQSPEAAILMICDAVESGVRSIKSPNVERVRDFVDKIIQARAMDRQFDESNLTLKELDIIKEVVTRRVVAAHHTRIAYPDRKPDRKAGNVVRLQGGP